MKFPSIIALAAGVILFNKILSDNSSSPKQDKGFIIVNCNKLQIINPKSFRIYIDKILNKLHDNKYLTPINNPKTPLNFSALFLKEIAPKCYEHYINDSYENVQQLIITYTLISIAYVHYHSWIVSIPYKNLGFKSLEELNYFTLKAREVFKAWKEPLMQRFGITSEQLSIAIIPDTNPLQIVSYP